MDKHSSAGHENFRKILKFTVDIDNQLIKRLLKSSLLIFAANFTLSTKLLLV